MMTHFLERIELQGFKSFAPKTVLDFPSRVTAIVGPNGSGKSNVIDALRWVLGERAASELRGAALENLIFSGTSKRPAAGFARVSLVFHNTPRLFPLDAPEVVVERRTDRSGVSSFSVNGDEVRLKDLIPMLARARLGSRGLTMVGQGQSDMFVRSTPRERRVMIEEVLGLREFRIKKEQSERQLASSLINMEKVRAMLDELAPHLRFLRKQKHRFEKRSDIESNLRELENVYFGARAHAFAQELKDTEAPHAEIKKEFRAKEEEVRVLEREREEFSRGTSHEEEIKKLHDARRAAEERRRALERDLARLEVEEELAVKKAEASEKDVRRLSMLLSRTTEELKRALVLGDVAAMRTAVEAVVQTLEREMKGEANVASAFGERVKKIRNELVGIEKDLAAFEKSESALLTSERAATEAFKLKVAVLEKKKNELRTLERAREEKTFARERITLQLDELRHAWAVTGRDASELDTLPMPAEVPGEDAERKMLRMRGELAAIGEIDEVLVKEATETESRHEFLSREYEDVTKAAKNLEVLIRDLDEKIHSDFKKAFREVNDSFNTYFRLMFGGGKAHMKLTKPPTPKPVEENGEETVSPEADEPLASSEASESGRDPELVAGVEIDLSLPKKKITSLDMLSGGEKSLVSLAALFALIAVSPPPFLVLDEIDAPLDDDNAARFAELVKEFAKKTQFIIVTHNRATMEAADVLYGITMEDDGVSKVLSLKLEG